MSEEPVPIADAPDYAICDTSSCGLAEEFLKQRCTDSSGRRTLRFWRNEFYLWRDGVYKRMRPEALSATVYAFLRGLMIRKNVGTRAKPKLRNLPLQPEPRDVRDVVATLAHETYIDVGKMPGWATDVGASMPPADKVISFRNGLLDLDQLIRDDGLAAMIEPTPEFFSENRLPFDFEWEAQCPTWESFLREALSEDQERIYLLQEWMGLNLSSDLRWQKMLWLHGPPGSGKGTILRQLRRCLGTANVVTPTLTELADKFGLEPLVGKSAAIISDAHLDRGGNTIAVLDRILSITGQDAMNIQRKNISTLTDVTLGVRFSIGLNKMPYLPDASNAIMRRLLLIPFNVSFAGREDRNLDYKLSRETPGILAWSLRGLMRLQVNDAFTNVSAAQSLLSQFRRQNSPIGAFIDDRCVIGKDCRVPIEEFYQAYTAWRRENGHADVGTATMGTDLHSQGFPLERRRLGPRGFRTWHYIGIGMRVGGYDDDEGGDDEANAPLFG